jgi:two-component system NtrC family sensor kinase
MRSLRTIFLVNLGLFTAASSLLVSVSAVVLAGGDGSAGVLVALTYGAGSLMVFLAFGAWLVKRTVLTPLADLSRTADALAEGNGRVPEQSFEVLEFTALEGRFRAMAQRLLDAQGQVVRAEKLAAIGRLSAGLAHEIRNPLGALNTYVEVLKQRGVDGEVVDAMQQEVGRMDHIVAGLLDYARTRPGARVPADLAAVARSTVEFLTKQGALKGHGIELVADPDVPPVGADPHDLEQILVNLILNARDARPGGRIVVGVHRHLPGAKRRHSDEYHPDTGLRRKDRPAPPRPSGGTPVDGTLLIVADEGGGVAEEDRTRIFDPFFTTKGPGEGTGLGLAIVARAVHDAGGVVWVDRAREGGAVFKALFPAAPRSA